uniref:Uncharacterized protein n=1 Tax=Arion vulgaris TaxID=1028688 RepID=A0A0B6Y799_9EUPU
MAEQPKQKPSSQRRSRIKSVVSNDMCTVTDTKAFNIFLEQVGVRDRKHLN